MMPKPTKRKKKLWK